MPYARGSASRSSAFATLALAFGFTAVASVGGPASAAASAAPAIASPVAASAVPGVAASATPAVAASAVPGVAASASPGVAASATPVPLATPRYPLVVPPPGFAHVEASGEYDGGWMKVVGKQSHVVFVEETNDPAFGGVGGDLASYTASILAKLKTQPGRHVTAHGMKRICHGTRDGYVVRMRHTDASRSIDEYLLFGFSGQTMYAAIYAHDVAVPALPAAVTFVDSLCPP